MPRVCLPPNQEVDSAAGRPTADDLGRRVGADKFKAKRMAALPLLERKDRRVSSEIEAGTGNACVVAHARIALSNVGHEGERELDATFDGPLFGSSRRRGRGVGDGVETRRLYHE